MADQTACSQYCEAAALRSGSKWVWITQTLKEQRMIEPVSQKSKLGSAEIE
jgi:hypothetical protein